MTDRTHIFSKALYASRAPFSHVVICNGMGHVSGIIGQRRDTGELIGPGIGPQAELMFDNLATALGEAGFGLDALVATRLYLLDYADFEHINDLYRRRLSEPFPARTTLQVSALPLGAGVQIDAVFDATSPHPQHQNYGSPRT